MSQKKFKLNTNLPFFTSGKAISQFDCNNNCFLYRMDECSMVEFNLYKNQIIADGYTLHANHSIRDNYFYTLYKEDHVLHLYYTEHDNSARIVYDTNTNLLKTTRDENTILTETTLYQLELDYRTIDCGMCYIIHCCDGSFFIIDSAHMNSTNDHIRLYNHLRKLTPADRSIIISGWFFSHAHQDHIFKFMDFVRSDFKDVIIQGLYYNFPSLSSPGNETWKEDDKVTMREFDALVASMENVTIYKLHTGQKFFLENLEIEVLTTHEDLYPVPLTRFNDTSTILLMRVEGCKVLFLGDANVEESTIAVSRYGSYLKSDIVQVAHHGYNGSNVGIYFLAKSDVALYPVPQSRYEDVYETEANKTVRKLSKEIYIAGNGTVGLPLPYVSNTAVRWEKEIH